MKLHLEKKRRMYAYNSGERGQRKNMSKLYVIDENMNMIDMIAGL